MDRSDELLGFTKTWPLLTIGVSCIALVTIVTVSMYIKYLAFQKPRDSKFLYIFSFHFYVVILDPSTDIA